MSSRVRAIVAGATGYSGRDLIGLLLIDQHVAHERILFERHWRALRGKRVEVQRMLIPDTIDLTPAQASAFDQLLPELEENGFELGRLSGRTVAIKAVPAMLAPGWRSRCSPNCSTRLKRIEGDCRWTN